MPKYGLVLPTESSKSMKGKMKQKKHVTLVWWFVECHMLSHNFNITVTEQHIDEFVAIDNESTHVFHEVIL